MFKSIRPHQYESKHGEEPLIGRKIVKPTPTYNSADAHNTLSDIRALEYLTAANALNMGDVAFCTGDKYLAALWCALKFKKGGWNASDVNFNIELDYQLFPRLSKSEIYELSERMMKITLNQ